MKLDAGLDDDDLALLMAHDTDAFTRWDAGQRLAAKVLLALVRDHAAGRPRRPTIDPRLVARSPPASSASADDPAWPRAP